MLVSAPGFHIVCKLFWTFIGDLIPSDCRADESRSDTPGNIEGNKYSGMKMRAENEDSR